jgi:hypothetical protein
VGLLVDDAQLERNASLVAWDRVNNLDMIHLIASRLKGVDAWRRVTGCRTPHSSQNAVMPRLTANAPVRVSVA